MNIVDKIKVLAKERNLTLAELERKLDFGNGTIARWRTRTPGADKLKLVAEHFNVSVDYLIGRESYEQMKFDQANRDFMGVKESEVYYAIQRESKKLSVEDQKRLYNIMKAAFKSADELKEDEDGFL